MLKSVCYIAAAIVVMLYAAGGTAVPYNATNQAELAKKTLDPLSHLISLPIHFNADHKTGLTDDDKKYVSNIQLPFSYTIIRLLRYRSKAIRLPLEGNLVQRSLGSYLNR